MVVPVGHDRDPRHHRRRRRPLLVDPEARRQDGRDPRLHEQDLVQGQRPGVYEGQCAELCGRNHANMLAAVRAVPAEEYQRWYDRQAADIEAAQDQAAAARGADPQQGEQAAEGAAAAPTTPATPSSASHPEDRTPCMATIATAPAAAPTGLVAAAPQIIARPRQAPSRRAGRRGSPPPITRRSGSCTSGRSPSSSCWAASRRC